jgi:hypothetical protein
MKSVKEYVKSTNRSKEVRDNVKAFKEILVTYYRHATNKFDMSDCIIGFAVILHILSKPTITCNRSDLATSRRTVSSSTEDIGEALTDFWMRMKTDIFAMSRGDLDDIVEENDNLFRIKSHCVERFVNHVLTRARTEVVEPFQVHCKAIVGAEATLSVSVGFGVMDADFSDDR